MPSMQEAAAQSPARLPVVRLTTGCSLQGFSSGQEFVVAIREANALNATIVLGDRGVDHTLARLQESLDGSGIDAVQKWVPQAQRFGQKQPAVFGDPSVGLRFIKAQTESPLSVRLSGDLEAEGVTDKEELTRTIEALKERSTVRELMGTLKATLPKVRRFVWHNGLSAGNTLECKARACLLDVCG